MGTGTLSGDETMTKFFYLPSEKGFYSKRKEFAPYFWVDHFSEN